MTVDSETRQNLATLEGRLAAGEVVFLVGSGIGNDSGVANVTDVVGKTLDRLVGDVCDDERRWVIDEVQPELFYSVVIECTGGDACLGVWKCMDPAEWGQPGVLPEYDPPPSAAHLFIAAYSHRARVPVFTTNFDPLFERASDKLGIPYRVIARKPSEEDLADDGSLKICKLHGGVGAHGERITADMVATTMDGISRRNVPWLDYIAGLLESRDLCLAGYSGRDIDYYPELKERKLASAGGRDWLWFVGPRPGGGLAGPQARAAGAVLLAMRPKQAVEEMRGRLLGGWGRAGAAASTAIGEALAPGYAEGSMNAKDEFLNLVLDKHLRGVELDAGLFWLVLYLRMGLLGKAEGALRACEGQASSSGRNWSVREQALLLSAELTLRREFADFEGYRAAARRLLALAGDARKGDPSFEGAWANARLQVVSSYQMEIPAHLCFPVPLVQRRYPLLALISVRYPLLIRDLARLRERHDRKHPSDRRGFVEHNPYVGVENEARVRWLAVKTGYALRLGGVLRARVVRELRELYEDAVLSGNYGTALGVAVYLDRLGDSGEWLDKVEWSTGILKEKSFLSRSLRDRGDYDGALAQAEASGNVLNAVKALMGKAHARYENLGSIWGNVSLLEADDLEKLDRYTERVTPAKLRNTIKGLRDGYICPMRA